LTAKQDIAALTAQVAELNGHVRFLMAQFARMAKHTGLPPAVAAAAVAVVDPQVAQINASMGVTQAAVLQGRRPAQPLRGPLDRTEEGAIAHRQAMDLERLQNEQRPAESVGYQTPVPGWANRQPGVHHAALGEIKRTEAAFKDGKSVSRP
jgi:hypothetical protein